MFVPNVKRFLRYRVHKKGTVVQYMIVPSWDVTRTDTSLSSRCQNSEIVTVSWPVKLPKKKQYANGNLGVDVEVHVTEKQR